MRTGAERNALGIPDSLVADFAALPAGWAWILVSRDRVIVSPWERRREHRPPAWFGGVVQLAADRARHRVTFGGAGNVMGDSAGVAMLSLGSG